MNCNTYLTVGKRGLQRIVVAGVIVPLSVSAQTTLTVGNTPAYPGATVSVAVTPRHATNAVAGQFDLVFNTNKVISGHNMSVTSSRHKVRSREMAPGVRRVVSYSLANTAISNRPLAAIPFTLSAREYVGSGPITPTNILLAKRDATALTPVTGISGQVFARPVNRNSDGTVQFFLPSQPDTRYLIQATTDFVHWVNLTNTTALGNFMDLVDEDATRYPYRFYRWVLYDAAGEIGAVTLLPGGQLSFRLSGLAGRTYVLQASSDLQAWTDLSTNVATTGTLNLTNMIDPAFPKRFFRLKSD
jgi:hypothetical protein